MSTTLRRHTIADVAKAAGVSKTAVSFAFNAPDRLGTDTVTHIIDVATALGYRPHPVASSLARRRTGTMAILTPQPLGEIFANPYHALFASGVATRGRGGGLRPPVHLAVARLAGPGGRARERRRDHRGRPGSEPSRGRPDPPVGPADRARRCRRVGARPERLGRRRSRRLRGGRAPAGARPPRRPGPQRRAARPGPTGSRRRSRRNAWRAIGVRSRTPAPCCRDDHVVSAPTTIRGGHEAFAGAWADGQRPTAVLAMSDVTAIGALHATRETGIARPRRPLDRGLRRHRARALHRPATHHHPSAGPREGQDRGPPAAA